jgi:ectoine hydroxylase-related dioxygenase (phytanoyl-CoA dioxygenase family)
MTVKDALRALGVRDNTLAQEEVDFLEQNGYLVLNHIMTGSQIEAFTARLQELSESDGAQLQREAVPEEGMIKLFDLVNKGDIFDLCFTHPRVLAAMAQMLDDDVKLHSLGSRCATPGHGLQELHVDFGTNLGSGPWVGCNSVWLLEDFTEENGATRLVPGSHRIGQHPRDVMADPKRGHPLEIQITAPAGSVVVFTGHTWHGGALNRSGQIRWAMHCAFCCRDCPQDPVLQQILLPEVWQRLGEAERVIVDVEAGF